MTVTFASDASSIDVPSLELLSKPGSRRFNLKKRSMSSDENKMNLSSYNSAFLSGLFADVAQASQSPEDETEPFFTSSSEEGREAEDHRLDQTLPVKRSRVSLTKSLSRSARSYKSLAADAIAASPIGVDMFREPSAPSVHTMEPSCSASMQRMNSLHFQLNSIMDAPNPVSPKSVKSVVDIIDKAFPHLPPTVSDSSCSPQDLTQKSDRPMSDFSETTNVTAKESYGWFLDLDDGDDLDEHDSSDPYNRSPTSDLAFQAPTAPKRKSNYEAEVEWARAADTVDDVLGDFF